MLIPSSRPFILLAYRTASTALLTGLITAGSGAFAQGATNPAPPPPPVLAPAPAPEAPPPDAKKEAPKVDCSKAENRKKPVCNQHKDPGIERKPTVQHDPGMVRTPPPTGDGAAREVPPQGK